MNNNSSKQILLSVLGVAILVVAVVGVSFAAFTFSQAGQKENVITTGTVTLNYTEKEGTAIKIDNAEPTTMATGKKLSGENQYFDFNVTATITGETTINYVVTAKKQISSTLTDNDVYLYLEKIESEETPATTEGEATSVFTTNPQHYKAEEAQDESTGRPADEMVLDTGTFSQASSDPVYYRLRMWLSDQYGSEDPTGKVFETQKNFSVKVNVYAKAAA